MDLRKLNHAVVLARQLSFTKAAEALNLTQPALSRSIRALEEECQIKLFDRDQGGVALTQAGREFVRCAESMLRHAAEMRSIVNQVAHGKGGRVALGMTPVAARILLEHLLRPHVGEQHFHASIVIEGERKMLPMVLDESLDLCIGSDPVVVAHPSLSAIPLARLRVAVLVRKGHPLTGMADLRVQHLEPFPLIRSRPFEFDDQSPVIVGPADGKPPAVTVEDYEILARLAANTDAVWVTTPLASQEALGRGDLVELTVSSFSEIPSTRLTAYVLKRRTLSPLAQRMRDEIIAMSGELPGL